jgi:pilus assembly protein Flp/PilA
VNNREQLDHVGKERMLILQQNSELPSWHATCNKQYIQMLSEYFTREGYTMNKLMIMLYLRAQSLLHREEGQDLTEYALLLALIACVVVASVTKLGSSVDSVFTSITGGLAAKS